MAKGKELKMEAEGASLKPGPDGKKSTTEAAAIPKANLPEGEAPVKKEKVLIPNIIRGRMPIAVVYMVRFGDQKGGETKELATMFGTTVGKITDIKKMSTFAYLPITFKPTQAQKDDGIAWLQRHVGFKDGKVDKLINELEAMEVATAEEAAKFEATRAASKGQVTRTKSGDIANAGGGNRRVAPKAPKAPTAKAESVGNVSADDLLK